jgi:signal transduction histidine kinase
MKPQRTQRSLADLRAAWDRAREEIDAAVAQTAEPGARAVRLAGALRSLWPSSALYACALRGEGRLHVGATDSAGNPRPDWAEALRVLLGGSAAPGALRTDLDKPPVLPGLRGQVLLVERVGSADLAPGAFVLAVPEKEAGDRIGLAWALLSECAEHLAARLAPGRLLPDQAWLVNVGDMSGAAFHEINNALNAIVLQLAVFEVEASESMRADVAATRRLVTNAASVVRQVQALSWRQRPEPRPADLNAVIRAAVQAATSAAGDQESPAVPEGVKVGLDLAPDLPRVSTIPSDLLRLVGLLVTQAARSMAGPGEVRVRTAARDGRVVLRVEDLGAQVHAEQLTQVFDLFAVPREGLEGWELAVCRSIARRQQATIEAENRPDGGMAVTVEFPAAEEG